MNVFENGREQDYSRAVVYVNLKQIIFFEASCADPESFVRGGPNLITFFCVFLVDEGIEDRNTAINGPSSAHQRNAI